MKKWLYLIVAVAFVAGGIISIAIAQPDKVTIDNKYPKKLKCPVTLPHKAHADTIACTECHHTWKKEMRSMVNVKNTIATASAAALLLGASGAVVAGDSMKLDPQASALLKKLSDYMGGLKSFSADAYVFDEQIMGDGFKLSVLGAGSIKVQRPNKFFIAYEDMARDREVFFDGSRLVVHGKDIGKFIEVPVTGNADLDAALDAVTDTLGAELPARDLLSTDAYTPLMEPVEESAYLGAVEIGDVTCRQLAFRTDEVDWQLWVEEGERPLPCRYTITSKWTYGAPQYSVTFSNWQVNPELADSDFTFSAPEGTKSTTVEEFLKMLKQAESE